MFLSIFSTPPYASKDFQSQLKSASRALNTILRHWTGIFLFCQFEKRSLNSVISALRLPNDDVKLAVLNLIRDLLIVNLEGTIPIQLHFILDYANHFKALLLILFVDSGLFEAMAEMIYHSSPSISQPAISFTRELIKLSKLLLPDSMAIHLQSIPELFFFSLQFRGNECMRQSALMAMTAIDQSLLKLKLSTTLRRSSFLTLKETLSFKRRHSNSNTTQVERA
ncbi:hypothetical protein HMI56_005732, partial [Coelomomyces lativittatus]